jgi:hypothetical protein
MSALDPDLAALSADGVTLGTPGALAALARSIDARSMCCGWPMRLTNKKKYARKAWTNVPAVFRLLASIDVGSDDECWIWNKNRSASGYGQISVGNKLRVANHLILAAEGRVRPSLRHNALHSCDNPPCCNPKHLRWGTQQENSADMMARGRHVMPRNNPIYAARRAMTHCQRGHSFAEHGRVAKSGKRQCSACGTLRARGGAHVAHA